MTWEKVIQEPCISAIDVERGLKLYSYGSIYGREGLLDEPNPLVCDGYPWSIEGENLFIPFLTKEYSHSLEAKKGITDSEGKKRCPYNICIEHLGVHTKMRQKHLFTERDLSKEQKELSIITSTHPKFQEYFELISSTLIEFNKSYGFNIEQNIEKIYYICPETKQEFIYNNSYYKSPYL